MDTLLNSSNSFLIEPTKTTPHVAFHSDLSLLEIKGVSNLPDTLNFYAPVFTFIEYLQSFGINHINVHLALLYFNSGSAKALFMILKKIEGLSDTVTCDIKWFCDEEDEDMIENVQVLNETLNLNIELVTGKLNE
ncbi:MAG: DUF1987 domain-containing protein [Bacteroidota bacterium]